MNREERWRAIYESLVYDPDADPVVLKNKADIQDYTLLELYEREQVKDRMNEGLPAAALEQTPEGLKALHKHLFQDVYEWAGEYRGYPTGRGQNFSLPDYIELHTDTLFRQVRAENGLKGMDPEQFSDRAAVYVNQINAIHPFVDGNGRAQRTWLRHTADAAGYSVGIRSEDQDTWNKMSMLGHITADNAETGYSSNDPMRAYIRARLEVPGASLSSGDADALAKKIEAFENAADRIKQEMIDREQAQDLLDKYDLHDRSPANDVRDRGNDNGQEH